MKQIILAESIITINGRIQQRILKEDSVYLQLSEGENKWRLPEAVLNFPKKRRRISNFYHDR